MIKIKRGLELPISGAPEQSVFDGPTVRSVAVIVDDYLGIDPVLAVAVGERVKTGQLLFTDSKGPGVNYTAPATGLIRTIHRDNSGVAQSVVIDIEPDEFVEFERFDAATLPELPPEKVRAQLLEAGLWSAFRTRPYSKVPAPDARPHSIFITAIDTHPLAPRPELLIEAQREAFCCGIAAVSLLTDGKLFVCKEPGVLLPIPNNVINVQVAEFGGPHPAGLPGTHIHFLDPVSANKQVWHIGYQDVIAIGRLLTEGRLHAERVIALAGPQVDDPRLIRTRLGASLDELCDGQLKAGENRVISGSVFGGRIAHGALAYLGRYHNQVSVLLEGRQRERLGCLSLGVNRYSTLNIYLSKFLPGKRFAFTTSTNGSKRAMVPVGAYQAVMPLDILPAHLLRALIAGDTELAQQLGALELDEEDLSLCTYVCPSKGEYGPILRDNLVQIELGQIALGHSKQEG